MNPRAIVAVILALCILLYISATFGLRMFGGNLATSPELVQSWEVTLAAIIGALSVYIAGKGDDK